MKKFAVVVSALLVLSASASSPAFASFSRFEYKLQSVLAVFYHSMLPFSGVWIVPGEFNPPADGKDFGPRAGGDADDLANGKNLPIDSKPNGSGGTEPTDLGWRGSGK
jgi:hypothetical protein